MTHPTANASHLTQTRRKKSEPVQLFQHFAATTAGRPPLVIFRHYVKLRRHFQQPTLSPFASQSFRLCVCVCVDVCEVFLSASVSSSSAVREVWSPQRHQDHRKWEESQVGFCFLKGLVNLVSFFFIKSETHVISVVFVTNRKNWTSSWTVLQGYSLLFAKGQGGSTSWVGVPSVSHRQFFLSLCYFSLPYFYIVTCLHCLLCCEVCHPLCFFFSLLSSLKSYYRSGSIPELLLTLLSNWKRSVKPRPAVSYVNCRPVQAAAVCSPPLSLPLHVFSCLFLTLLPGH